MPVMSGFGALMQLPWERVTDKIERRILAGRQGMIVWWKMFAWDVPPVLAEHDGADVAAISVEPPSDLDVREANPFEPKHLVHIGFGKAGTGGEPAA